MGIYIQNISKDDFLNMYHSTKSGTYIGFDPNSIVEILVPHGGLIDAEDLIKILDVSVEIEGEENAKNVVKAFNEVLDTIRGMSPVIEAEGE